MSDSVRPHRRQPIRLPRPWDSPGKNTGAGCHFLLQCMKVKSESEVAQRTESHSSRPHGLQPTRLLRPWDFPGKSTGVGLCPKPSSGSCLQTKRQVPYKGLQSSPAPTHPSDTLASLLILEHLEAGSCLRAFAFCLECSPPNSCLIHSFTSPRSFAQLSLSW